MNTGILDTAIARLLSTNLRPLNLRRLSQLRRRCVAAWTQLCPAGAVAIGRFGRSRCAAGAGELWFCLGDSKTFRLWMAQEAGLSNELASFLCRKKFDSQHEGGTFCEILGQRLID